VLTQKHGLKITTGFLNMGSVTNLRENKTIFIPCSCKSELLVIEYDHTINMADVAIYENADSYSHKMSLWQRLRYCYNVLLRRKPYADQMVLDKKQLRDLQNFLNGLSL
jgi:hypothetical protein